MGESPSQPRSGFKPDSSVSGTDAPDTGISRGCSIAHWFKPPSAGTGDAAGPTVKAALRFLRNWPERGAAALGKRGVFQGRLVDASVLTLSPIFPFLSLFWLTSKDTAKEVEVSQLKHSHRQCGGKIMAAERQLSRVWGLRLHSNQTKTISCQHRVSRSIQQHIKRISHSSKD